VSLRPFPVTAATDLLKPFATILAQSFVNLEMIAIRTNGSTDQTAQILSIRSKTQRVRVYLRRTAGLPPHWNRAFAGAWPLQHPRRQVDDTGGVADASGEQVSFLVPIRITR